MVRIQKESSGAGAVSDANNIATVIVLKYMFLVSLYVLLPSETATPWLSQEALVLQAAKHVKMAKLQRLLFNRKKDEAFEDRDKAKEERVFTFVADYSQNMYLPNFAEAQPGETYYYSPLNAYCFGVVDASTRPSKLSAHIYLEDLGKKGGDNVASLLWKQLQLNRLVPTDNSKPSIPAKEINFVFDNCGGQNKNRMVLRLPNLMVKRGICKTARCIFLVRGHTKNDCDRLFNLMKQDYRISNIYNLEELIGAVGKHPDVSPETVLEGDFCNFDSMEDKYMAKPLKVQENHIFEATTEDPNALYLYEYDGEAPKKQVLVRPPYRDIDWTDEALSLLSAKQRVGLQEIKWIELYDKWRPLIPVERQTFHYIRNPPTLDSRNKVKLHTKESKKQRKERSRTEEQAAKAEEQEEQQQFGGIQPAVEAVEKEVANTPQKI